MFIFLYKCFLTEAIIANINLDEQNLITIQQSFSICSRFSLLINYILFHIQHYIHVLCFSINSQFSLTHI